MKVYNFEDLHKIIQGHDQETTVYRGVKDDSYELIPKVGGKNFICKHKSVKDAEKYMLSLFKQRAIPFLTLSPRNDWEWLALAQHYGLPTRLLD